MDLLVLTARRTAMAATMLLAGLGRRRFDGYQLEAELLGGSTQTMEAFGLIGLLGSFHALPNICLAIFE